MALLGLIYSVPGTARRIFYGGSTVAKKKAAKKAAAPKKAAKKAAKKAVKKKK